MMAFCCIHIHPLSTKEDLTVHISCNQTDCCFGLVTTTGRIECDFDFDVFDVFCMHV